MSDGDRRPRYSPEAARLAAEHVDLAIRTLVDVLERGGRDGMHRVEAARLLLEVASACPAAFMSAGGATNEAPPLDELSAARQRRRLEQKLDEHERDRT